MQNRVPGVRPSSGDKTVCPLVLGVFWMAAVPHQCCRACLPWEQVEKHHGDPPRFCCRPHTSSRLRLPDGGGKRSNAIRDSEKAEQALRNGLENLTRRSQPLKKESENLTKRNDPFQRAGLSGANRTVQEGRENLRKGSKQSCVAISVICVFLLSWARSEHAVNIEVSVSSQHALCRQCYVQTAAFRV